jgi:hypothetical protein
MDAFSYLSVVTSIIIALGIARILSGLGMMIEARKKIRLYYIHMLWAVNIFLFLVLNWWILFRWESYQDWNYFLFLFLLLTPTVSFLLTVLLFPTTPSGHEDFKEHFFDNHRWFFILGSALPVLDFVDTYLKGYEHLVSQGPIYLLTIILISVLSVVAALVRNERFHAFFAAFFFCYLLVFININLNVLN